MLGEIISEERGKIIGTRVLEGPFPTIESSFTATGKLLGVEVQDMGTYESVTRPDGSISGHGQGLTRGKDGSAAYWKGLGVGTPKPDGSVSYRGSLVFTTQSEKWSRLNKAAVVFEFDVDPSGNTTEKGFEWR